MTTKSTLGFTAPVKTEGEIEFVVSLNKESLNKNNMMGFNDLGRNNMKKTTSQSTFNPFSPSFLTPKKFSKIEIPKSEQNLVKPIKIDKKSFVSEKKNIKVNYDGFSDFNSSKSSMAPRSSRSTSKGRMVSSSSSSVTRIQNVDRERALAYSRLLNISPRKENSKSKITSKNLNVDDVIKNELMYKKHLQKENENLEKEARENPKVEEKSNIKEGKDSKDKKENKEKQPEVTDKSGDSNDNPFFSDLIELFIHINQLIEVNCN